METPRTRRVQRIRLAQPIVGRLGSTQVVLVDLSVLGARVEHHLPLAAGAFSKLTFQWDDRPLTLECRIVRSRLERFQAGANGLTVYHSGLEFDRLPAATTAELKRIIGSFITRALEEQKLNARGVLPQHDVERMPIFRFGGQLSANAKEKDFGSMLLPTSRVAKETGYVCYAFDDRNWRRKRTHDPGQPPNGFTISADEDHTQAELLCDAYMRSDSDGRRLIQLFAQLSIVEGEGVSPTRFQP